MRKYKRFIKKFSERFIVYIVVFVAFVNACFFVPMEVQAQFVGGAETIYFIEDFPGLNYSSSYISGQEDPWYGYFDLSSPWEPSSSRRFTVDVNFVCSSESSSTSLSDGNYFVYSFLLRFWNNVGESSYFDPTVYTDFILINPAPNIDIQMFVGSAWREFNGISTIEYVPITFAGSYSSSHEINRVHLEFDMALRYWGVNAPSISNMYWVVQTQSLQVFDTSQEYSNVLEQIRQNTGETTDAVNNGFNQAMNGYDDSSGNQAVSDFESGVNNYDSAEDNLFNQSESALSGFEFFDFSTYTGITTGLTFVSSLLTSIYNNFGGMQGIGIVLSVMFSVLFMAIVIGLFRYYK